MKEPLQEDQRQQLQAAIASAEKHCSGEIRVHVAETCTRDALIEARYWFQKLSMHKTALRNGVLFYIALDSRKYAILGDQGIHEKVGQAFWEEVRDAMHPALEESDWVGALCAGIAQAGEALATHFPYVGSADINELPDEISHSK
jgi:uncharacterized membrane protein